MFICSGIQVGRLMYINFQKVEPSSSALPVRVATSKNFNSHQLIKKITSVEK